MFCIYRATADALSYPAPGSGLTRLAPPHRRATPHREGVHWLLTQVIHRCSAYDSDVSGLAAMIAGLALLHREDEVRLARGSELFEELLAYFGRKRS